MANKRMRAFLFYIDDWLSSKAIAMMDAAEERGYLRLLLAAAGEPDGGLPDDDEELAILSLLGEQWFQPTADKSKRLGSRTSGEKLRRSFVVRNGRLYNERLLKEFNHQKEVKASRIKAGQKGGVAKALAKQTGSNCQANAKQTTQQKPANNSLGLGLGLGFSEEKHSEETPSDEFNKSNSDIPAENTPPPEPEFDLDAGFARLVELFPRANGVFSGKAQYYERITETPHHRQNHERLEAGARNWRRSLSWHRDRVHHVDNFLYKRVDLETPTPCPCGGDDPLRCPNRNQDQPRNGAQRRDPTRDAVLSKPNNREMSSSSGIGPKACGQVIVMGAIAHAR